MDCSPPGSSVHGISQARILQWVAMPSSRGSFRPRDWTYISYVSCIAGGFFTTSTIWEASQYFNWYGCIAIYGPHLHAGCKNSSSLLPCWFPLSPKVGQWGSVRKAWRYWPWLQVMERELTWDGFLGFSILGRGSLQQTTWENYIDPGNQKNWTIIQTLWGEACRSLKVRENWDFMI